MRLVPRSDLATCAILGISEKRCFTWLVATLLSIALCGRRRAAGRPAAYVIPAAGAEDTIFRPSPDHPTPLEARSSGPLAGKVRVPGDKSISHRALILGALAVGKTRISGLLEGEDGLNTAKAMRALGASVERTGDFAWVVRGVGVTGFAEPQTPLDFGNSGTGCRLVMGAVAGCPISAVFDGDASLRSRPMRRILDPLELMGAKAGESREGGRLPLTLHGARDPLPILYRTPVASAQIKSAVLLAGLAAPGITTVIETEASRDHTELMLRHFGAQIVSMPE